MTSTREPLEPRSRPWIWFVYLGLFAVVIPWYVPSDAPVRYWLGLPHWTVISLAAQFAVGVFTLFVVARYWSDAPPDNDAGDAGERD